MFLIHIEQLVFVEMDPSVHPVACAVAAGTEMLAIWFHCLVTNILRTIS